MIARPRRAELPLWAAIVFPPTLTLLLAVWGAWAACRHWDLRVGYSPSVPIGVYRLDPAPARRGDYVIFCPPPSPVFAAAMRNHWIARGDCPAGTRQLMKLVIAGEGDHVLFRDDGVFVDGRRVPNSGARTKDAHGIVLPRPAVREFDLQRDERVLMSLRGPDSFDARYFGPIKGQVVGHLESVFTWEM
jgi:conjugative transfer signal peptidase TraF